MRQWFAGRQNYKYWAFGAIGLGTFGTVVDHGSVNIVVPIISEDFGADLPSAQWVVISFALTISALLLPLGRLADRVGRTKMYIAGSVVFILGAALAGAAPNLTTLILARVLQGVGAAMTQGTGMAIISSVFPANERGKAIGLLMTVVGIGAVTGPAVGGTLTSLVDWRLVFFINVPLGILGIAACLAVLNDPEEKAISERARTRGFDWLGALLSAGMLVTFILTITNGQRVGWGSPTILLGLVGSLALLGAFVSWQLRASEPVLDLRLFKDRIFSLGVMAAFLTFLGSSAVLFLNPFYLQNVLNYSPRETGLIVVPGALCMAALGPISGRLSDRYGWRPMTMAGLSMSAAGLFLLSRVTEDSSLTLILAGLMLQNSGMGTFYSPNTTSVLSIVDRERYGLVSGLLNLVRNTANITSVAVATAIVTVTMSIKGFEPDLDLVSSGGGAGVGTAFVTGLRYAYMSMGCMLVLAVAVSGLQKQKRVDMPATEVGG